MAEYQTTKEKWVCPDCGHTEWAIVPSGCKCDETDTCQCGEQKRADDAYCESCTANLHCGTCGKDIPLDQDGECVPCYVNRINDELTRKYMTTSMPVGVFLKHRSENLSILTNQNH
jgi:hypothetical protein